MDHSNLALSLDRADELLSEMLTEYNTSLAAKNVSPRAVHLTHEVCGLLRSILDRTARRYWDASILPHIRPEDAKRATVYFPIADDQHSFESTLGRWQWKSVRSDHQALYVALLSLQPFVDGKYRWLAVLNDLAVHGKHIGLLPQKRTEARRVTAKHPSSSSISWTPWTPGQGGVRFTRGVRILGAPIDPSTQRTVPGYGLEEREEVWVSFMIEGHNVNAAGFCKDACANTRLIVQDLSDRFGLS